MTEQEWMECKLPGKMVWSSREMITNRKRTLLEVACLRRIEQFLPGPVSKQSVNLLERYADGDAIEAELASMRTDALEEAREFPNPHGKQLPESFAGVAVYYSDDAELLMDNCAEATAWAKAGTPDAISGPEESAQCMLVREIFGNPFSPIIFDDQWRSETVIALAAGIYEERAFDTMPILAAALQEAGCDNDDILNHCHSDGPHVRGCWVVDLVLGKE